MKVKFKFLRRITGMRGGFEGENGGGRRTRVSCGLELGFVVC